MRFLRWDIKKIKAVSLDSCNTGNSAVAPRARRGGCDTAIRTQLNPIVLSSMWLRGRAVASRLFFNQGRSSARCLGLCSWVCRSR